VSVRVSAYGEIIDHALAFICTVGAGFILFALRIWGGGDSKLLMALAPITQPETLLLLIFLVVICGFFQAIGIIAYRCLRPHPDYRNEMPYGIAIACGAIIYLVLDTMVGMVELETIL
jgi:prepilin peptidase CpaA